MKSMQDSIEQLFLKASEPNLVVYQGRPLIRFDRYHVEDGERFRIVFEQVGSRWRQGIRLKSDFTMHFNSEQLSKNMVLWADRSAPEVEFICQTQAKGGELILYNAWDSGNGTIDSWLGNAAMLAEDVPSGRRYRCNDSFPDDDFADLIFLFERVSSSPESKP